MSNDKTSIWLCACICLTCLVGRVAPTIAAEESRPTGALTGSVVDEHGKAIVGAEVTIKEWRGGSKVVARARSDEAGRFTASDVPAGCRFCAVIDSDDLGREFRDDLCVYPRRATDLGEIRLYKSCVCQGRVMNVNGDPAPNVQVIVSAYKHELGHTITLCGSPWRLRTDAEGGYSTPPLPPGLVIFQVKSGNSLVAARGGGQWIGPQSAARVEDMLVAPEVSLEGVVTDTLGNPIADAEVGHNPGFGEYITTKTNALGRFALGGCSVANIRKARLSVEARGFANYEEDEPIAEIPRKIRLKPCNYISGRAIDAVTGEGVQIERIVVCEVERDANGAPHATGCGEARFDQPTKGEFRASVSTAGEKHLTIMAKGYQTSEEYVLDFGVSGEARGVTVKMRPSGASISVAKQRIRGTVTADGKPAGEAWVTLWSLLEEMNRANACTLRGRTVDGACRVQGIDVLTNSAGEYLLDVPDPGDYFVVARPFAGAPAISPLLRMAAGEERPCGLTLESPGTIRGRLTGTAASEAGRLWVVAFGHNPLRVATPADRNGEFVLTNLPAGELGLKVGYEGYVDADIARYAWVDEEWKQKSAPWSRAVKVVVHPGESVDGVELSCPPPGAPDRLFDD